MSDEENIRPLVRIILEIVGKPKEHIEKTMKLVIENIRQRKDHHVEDEKIFPPEPVEGLFTTFAELLIRFDNFSGLTEFCQDFLPSSVEIVEPEEILIYGRDISSFLNDVLAGMHSLDMRFKEMSVENQILKKNSEALLKNIVLISLHRKPMALQEISRTVGIKENELQPFLLRFSELGLIKKNGEVYEFVRMG